MKTHDSCFINKSEWVTLIFQSVYYPLHKVVPPGRHAEDSASCENENQEVESLWRFVCVAKLSNVQSETFGLEAG